VAMILLTSILARWATRKSVYWGSLTSKGNYKCREIYKIRISFLELCRQKREKTIQF
jgi:hypothetical protein